jgi:hypothetical protein
MRVSDKNKPIKSQAEQDLQAKFFLDLEPKPPRKVEFECNLNGLWPDIAQVELRTNPKGGRTFLTVSDIWEVKDSNIHWPQAIRQVKTYQKEASQLNSQYNNELHYLRSAGIISAVDSIQLRVSLNIYIVVPWGTKIDAWSAVCAREYISIIEYRDKPCQLIRGAQ